MKILKTRDVKTPTRGTPLSAGLDFFVPNDFATTTIKPFGAILIPSGIYANIPNGFGLVAFNKSGIALKKGLVVGASVVDEDYKNEIHLHVINTTDCYVMITPGEKLVQFLLLPVLYEDVELTDTMEECFEEKLKTSTRVGGFGSTN